MSGQQQDEGSRSSPLPKVGSTDQAGHANQATMTKTRQRGKRRQDLPSPKEVIPTSGTNYQPTEPKQPRTGTSHAVAPAPTCFDPRVEPPAVASSGHIAPLPFFSCPPLAAAARNPVDPDFHFLHGGYAGQMVPHTWPIPNAPPPLFPAAPFFQSGVFPTLSSRPHAVRCHVPPTSFTYPIQSRLPPVGTHPFGFPSSLGTVPARYNFFLPLDWSTFVGSRPASGQGRDPCGYNQASSFFTRMNLSPFLENLLWCCSDKEFSELQSFLRDNNHNLANVDIRYILQRLIEVRNIRVHWRATRRNNIFGHAFGKLRSCIHLVLAVLLVRIKIGTGNGVQNPVSLINKCKPESILYTVLRDIYSTINMVDFLIDRDTMRCQDLFTIITAVTIGDSELVNEELENYAKILLHDSSYDKMLLCKPLLLIAIISGNMHFLDYFLVTFTEQIIRLKGCIPSICCQVSMWASLFGLINVEAVLNKLEEFYKYVLSRVEDPFLLHCAGFMEVINFFSSPCFCQSEPCKEPSGVFFTYANFALNSKLIADRFVQRMFGACLSIGSFNHLENVRHLPQFILSLCLTAFEDLSQRNGAGAFLMLLQSKRMLEQVLPTHRKRLILFLVQCTIAQGVQPTSTPCELCQHPIVSFLIWMLKPESLLESCPDAGEIAGYCPDGGLQLLSRLQLRRRHVLLCEHHRKEMPNATTLATVIQKCEFYQANRSLQVLAILSVLRSLGRNFRMLRTIQMPGGLRKFFFLDYPQWAASGGDT